MKLLTILSLSLIHTPIHVVGDEATTKLRNKRRELNNGQGKHITIQANPLRNGGRCVGDCDEDKDCAGNLICFHRNKGQFLAVPGCIGGEEDYSRTDYCIDPNDMANIFEHNIEDKIDSSSNGGMEIIADIIEDDKKKEDDIGSAGSGSGSGSGEDGENNSDKDDGGTSSVVIMEEGESTTSKVEAPSSAAVQSYPQLFVTTIAALGFAVLVTVSC